MKACESYPQKLKLNTSSILVDSVKSLEEIAPKIFWQSNPKVRRRHYVSVANLTSGDEVWLAIVVTFLIALIVQP